MPHILNNIDLYNKLWGETSDKIKISEQILNRISVLKSNWISVPFVSLNVNYNPFKLGMKGTLNVL
jgi:hypothetical protein